MSRGFRTNGLMASLRDPLLGGEKSRRPVWRGGCGILGARQGHFREGNRKGEAVFEMILSRNFERPVALTSIIPNLPSTGNRSAIAHRIA